MIQTLDALIDYTKEIELAGSSGYGNKTMLTAIVHFYKKKIFFKVSCKREEKVWEYSFTDLDEAIDCYNKMI